MTWSHFTAYLDGSRPIYKAERDELWDNAASLLASTDCADSGYAINGSEQSAIKASRFRTDLTSLNAPGPVTMRGDLHAMLAAAASAFSNFSSASSSALATAGLTSGDRSAIIAAGVNHFRLWNYYRALIDALECDAPPPCTPPAPVVTGGATSGTVGVAFSYAIIASNSPTGYSASPLPAGLSLTGNVIDGTPTLAGSYTVSIGASNACGSGAASLEITINEPMPCSGEPTLLCKSIAASKSKCGYSEYAGHESSPPKYYLTRNWSGAVRQFTYDNPSTGGDGCNSTDLIEEYQMGFSGSCTYDRFTCETSGINTWEERRNGIPIDSGSGCETPMGSYFGWCGGECNPFTTANSATYNGLNACVGTFPAHFTFGSASETLTSEYSTAQLIADAEGALPSWPGTWDGDCLAIRDLSSDEVSYSVQRMTYKFQLPSMTGISAASITWVERFTPAGGGTPVDTPRSYTWDTVSTETGEYSVLEPATNGIVEIADVVMTCA